MTTTPEHVHLFDPRMADRFWDRVHAEPMTGCWLWTGGHNGIGYGRHRHEGKNAYTHRLIYQFTVGTIPPGLQVLHRCDTPACCNPSHLFLGTRSDNMRDMIAKVRGNNIKKTECIRGHAFDEANTRHNRKGRVCRACERFHGSNEERQRRAMERC